MDEQAVTRHLAPVRLCDASAARVLRAVARFGSDCKLERARGGAVLSPSSNRRPVNNRSFSAGVRRHMPYTFNEQSQQVTLHNMCGGPTVVWSADSVASSSSSDFL